MREAWPGGRVSDREGSPLGPRGRVLVNRPSRWSREKLIRRNQQYDLDPYYLNQRRIAQLVGVEAMGVTLRAVPWEVDDKNRALAIAAGYKALLRRWLVGAHPSAFEVLAASDRLRIGVAFTVFGDFASVATFAWRAHGGMPKPSSTRSTTRWAGTCGQVALRFRLGQEHVLPGSGGDLSYEGACEIFSSWEWYTKFWTLKSSPSQSSSGGSRRRGLSRRGAVQPLARSRPNGSTASSGLARSRDPHAPSLTR